jgi:hypothetical protein
VGLQDFEDELDLAEESPWQDVLYNIRPRVDQFMMNELGANPPLDLEELVAGQCSAFCRVSALEHSRHLSEKVAPASVVERFPGKQSSPHC